MNKLHKTTALALAAALALAGVGCSSDDDSNGDDGGTTGTEAPATGDTTAPADDDDGDDDENSASGCPETELTVVDVDGNATELEPVVSVADVIDLGAPESATISVTNYEVDTAELRGVYQPELSGDEIYVSFSMGTQGTFGPGEYVDQTADEAGDEIVNFTDIVTADGRQLPSANHVITVTEVTETEVCAEIAPIEDDPFGSYVTGNFVGERIDA